MTRSSQAGFSIIELTVALTIAGILLALGAPAMSGYLQNARLGSLAKSMYSGLQVARNEAVKRNQTVEFVMTNSPDTTNADTVVLDSTGKNWVVRWQSSASAAYQLVEQKSSNGSDAGNIAIAASSPSVVFNSLGGTTAGGALAISLTNPTLGLCAPAGPVRCWNVVVAPGGQVRLCSPDTSLPAGDSRAC